MKRKGADDVGDYDDSLSPVPAASGFCTILSLATQLDMFTDHVYKDDSCHQQFLTTVELFLQNLVSQKVDSSLK